MAAKMFLKKVKVLTQRRFGDTHLYVAPTGEFWKNSYKGHHLGTHYCQCDETGNLIDPWDTSPAGGVPSSNVIILEELDTPLAQLAQIAAAFLQKKASFQELRQAVEAI